MTAVGLSNAVKLIKAQTPPNPTSGPCTHRPVPVSPAIRMLSAPSPKKISSEEIGQITSYGPQSPSWHTFFYLAMFKITTRYTHFFLFLS